MFENLTKNQEAVSPIVATLVLIVVAVVGAVAVGTIMGTFSNDVADQANAGDVAGASAYEILIGGSTTVQPVSELLAKAFMAETPGVKINVQGGGSGVGVTAAGQGSVDIGAASRAVKDAEMEKYPNLKTTQIGGSAVVVIAGSGVGIDDVDRADLEEAIVNGTYNTALGNADHFVQRTESSGTEETFARWVLDDNSVDDIDEYLDTTGMTSATGNAGVLAAVKSNPNYIGFVDAGYALGDGVKILNITADGTTYGETTSKNILTALKEDKKGVTSTAYPNGLTRPLNYLTSGTPNSVVQKFIDFAQSPDAIESFHDAGMYSILEFS